MVFNAHWYPVIFIIFLNGFHAIFEDRNLLRFLGALERHENKQVDLVFVLDESDRIGYEFFPFELLLAELLARIISVSPSTTRVAVVSYSTSYIERFNYIKNPTGNMCTFISDLWKVDYKGSGDDITGALNAAGRILQEGRTDAIKLIVLVSTGRIADKGIEAAINLKRKDYKIFAIGVGNVDVEQLHAVATSEEYMYIVKDFEYLKLVNDMLIRDTNDVSWTPVENSSLCNGLCKEGNNCCGSNSTCSCGSKTGKYECVCNPGYFRSGDLEGKCLHNSPPSLKCPEDIHVDTEAMKPTALVGWQRPIVRDNDKVVELKVLYPPSLYKLPYTFNIGTSKVTYVAFDSSGLNATCSFQVTVKDSESPRVQYCPENITKSHVQRRGLVVTWKEPIFLDNSGIIRNVIQTHRSGSRFYWGNTHRVMYRAVDPSGNSAKCNFFVTIKPYECEYAPPPRNGAIICDTWLLGSICKIYCEDGYDFIARPEDAYMCYQRSDSATWGRLLSGRRKHQLKFPWPDCAKKVLLSRSRWRRKLSYYYCTCPSTEATRQLQENFVKYLKRYQRFLGICPNETCIPENVVVKCGKLTLSQIDDIVHRKRRSVGNASM